MIACRWSDQCRCSQSAWGRSLPAATPVNRHHSASLNLLRLWTFPLLFFSLVLGVINFYFFLLRLPISCSYLFIFTFLLLQNSACCNFCQLAPLFFFTPLSSFPWSLATESLVNWHHSVTDLGVFNFFFSFFYRRSQQHGKDVTPSNIYCAEFIITNYNHSCTIDADGRSACGRIVPWHIGSA